MAVELKHDGNENLLQIRVSGRLVKQDYEKFLPQIETMIHEHGKLRILLEMVDFHGWTLAALWEDFKFDLRHFRDIERVAMVGDKKWEAGMAVFCKPFTTAKIKYFDKSKRDEAVDWVTANQPSHAG